ncbi:hypothetical protein F5X96DRAFT_613698 [Biscogniauxia mediterranea]|nr:hypothetical protein F5X96DRAFT_613698 [Biscogniauxia mediterranea]
MSTLFPSIQAFYSKELPPSSPNSSDQPIPLNAGDGFTSSEIDAVLDPHSRPWQLTRIYEACPIALLQGGARDYQISGRIVNLSTTVASSPGHVSYSFLVVSDGSAVITIKLYHSHSSISASQLVLGRRINIWVTYIAQKQNGIEPIPFCFSATTIHPGINKAHYIVFHVDQIGSDNDRSLRHPIEIDISQHNCLPDLMTLKAFISSGYDLGEGRILVCVRSIGPRRTVHSKKQQEPLNLVEVGIFDDTANCMLKLWGDKVASARTWVPNKTILLILKPTCRIPERSNVHQAGVYPELGIGYNSIVDVDPDFAEADWLRKKVQDMSKKDSVHIPFPPNTWDVVRAMKGPDRILFTIAEVEDQVLHSETKSDFTGKVNVIILEMNLMDYWRRGKMCCTDCCGVPLYSNKPVATCKNCGAQKELFLNSRIIGSMIDESGAIASSKLGWNDDAWTQLFFGSILDEEPNDKTDGGNLIEQSWEDITALDTNSLRDLEDQLLYSRITLTFGWSSDLGRLCVIGVEW